MNKTGILAALSLSVSVAACTTPEAPLKGRWYSQAQVDEGKALYSANCAVCHGGNGEGTKDWKKRDAAGNLPPPPLNGTAHTWHHPTEILMKTITEGGAPWQGSMPGFGDRFSVEQKQAIIAFIQSLWSDEIFRKWKELSGE